MPRLALALTLLLAGCAHAPATQAPARPAGLSAALARSDFFPTKPGAVWQYEDKLVPTAGLSVAAGKHKEEFSPNPVSFDEMRPGAYDPIERVKDMDRAGILASICFPSFPRFCGQIFWEAKDKDLAALCV
jgi:hypothetical protein